MKKFCLWVLLAALCLSLMACGQSEQPTPATEAPTEAPLETTAATEAPATEPFDWDSLIGDLSGGSGCHIENDGADE